MPIKKLPPRDTAYECSRDKNNDCSRRAATSKGFETMDQETASKLDGFFLSLRVTAIDIKNQGLDKIKLLSKMDVNLGQVLTVSNETKSFVEEIKNIQRDSFYEIQWINKNTGMMSKILDKMAEDMRIVKEKL